MAPLSREKKEAALAKVHNSKGRHGLIRHAFSGDLDENNIDRRNYYRVVDHLGVALRQGALELVRGKLRTAGAEFDHAEELLRQAGTGGNNNEIKFLQTRLNRARQLRQRAARIFNNPMMKMLGL